MVSSIYLKLITKVMQEWLTDVVEQEHYLHEMQYGFRKQKSTMDAISIVQCIMAKARKLKQQIYLWFVDLGKIG